MNTSNGAVRGHNQPKRRNASVLKTPPKPPEKMTQAEINAELASITDEINGLEEGIRKRKRAAQKILHDSLDRAKRIGDLLARVKMLVPHGEYQEWVEDNFIGGLSTARAYKQIAENWSSIQTAMIKAPKADKSPWEGADHGRSIRWALANMEEKAPVPPEYKHDAESLLGRVERMIADWPGHIVTAATESEKSMGDLEKTLRGILIRHGGTPKKNKDEWAEWDRKPVKPRLVTLRSGRRILWYDRYSGLADHRNYLS